MAIWTTVSSSNPSHLHTNVAVECLIDCEGKISRMDEDISHGNFRVQQILVWVKTGQKFVETLFEDQNKEF